MSYLEHEIQVARGAWRCSGQDDPELSMRCMVVIDACQRTRKAAGMDYLPDDDGCVYALDLDTQQWSKIDEPQLHG